jgi:hypothetical protein
MIFLGPHDGLYVLLSKVRRSKESIWTVWCSKINNINGNGGIIERWRSEEQLDELLKNDIIRLVE